MDSPYELNITQDMLDEHLHRINFSIPGQPEHIIHIEIDSDFSPLPVNITHAPFTGRTSPSRQRIWGFAMLNQDTLQQFSTPCYFAVCGGNAVQVYSLDLELLQTYRVDGPAEEDFLTVAWGQWDSAPILAAGGKNGVVSIMNAAEGCFLYSLFGCKNIINELRFKPSNGSFLLCASSDFTVRMWNTKTRVQICIFHGPTGHRGAVLTLDWHQDESCFLSGGMDGSVKIWDASKLRGVECVSSLFDPQFDTRAEVPCATQPFRTKFVHVPLYSNSNVHKTSVECARFFHNLVISRSHEAIIVWKAHPHWKDDSAIVLFSFKCFACPEIRMHFGIDKRRVMLAVGGGGNSVSLYSIETGREVRLVCREGEAYVRHAGIAADGSLLAVGEDGWIYRSKIEVSH